MLANRTELAKKAKQIGSNLRPSSVKPFFVSLGVVVSMVSLAVMLMAVLGKSQNGGD